MLSIGGIDGKRHAIGGGIDDGHDEGGGRRNGMHEGEGLRALKVGGKRLGSLNFPCNEGLSEREKGEGGKEGEVDCVRGQRLSSEERHTPLLSHFLLPSSCNFATSLPTFLPLLGREVFQFDTEPGQG